MEFKFNINDIFKQPIVEINHNLIPPGFSGDRRALWDTVNKVSEVVNAMGEASANAQGLTKPITTSERLRNSEHRLYLLIDHDANKGKGAVTGMLKTGTKGLYVFDRDGQHYQVSPPCVLDFYVHETRQRNGLGKQIFEYMLQKEDTKPVRMAIDRPSDKFLGFLNKHYALQSPVKQMNNYVVFDGFFPKSTQGPNPVEADKSHTPCKKDSANGLQSHTSPYGRYGAPRPPCSMGQIIHNQTSTITKRQEPTGVQSMPIMNCPVDRDSPTPYSQVCQSTPNVCYREQQPADERVNVNQCNPQNSYCQNVPQVTYQICPKCNQTSSNTNVPLPTQEYPLQHSTSQIRQTPVATAIQNNEYPVKNAQVPLQNYQAAPGAYHPENVRLPVVQNQDNPLKMLQNVPTRVQSYHQQQPPNQYIQEGIHTQSLPPQHQIVNHVQVQGTPNQLQQTGSRPMVHQQEPIANAPSMPQGMYQAIDSNQNQLNTVVTPNVTHPSLPYQQQFMVPSGMQPVPSHTQMVDQVQNLPIDQGQYLHQKGMQATMQNVLVGQEPNLQQQQQFSSQNIQYIPQSVPQQQFSTLNNNQQSTLDMRQMNQGQMPPQQYSMDGNAVPTQSLIPNAPSRTNVTSTQSMPSNLQIQNIMDVNSNMNTTSTSLANASSMNFPTNPHGYYQPNPTMPNYNIHAQNQQLQQTQMPSGIIQRVPGTMQIPVQSTGEVAGGQQAVHENIAGSVSQNDMSQPAKSDTQMPRHVIPNPSHSMPNVQGQNERNVEYIETNTHAEGDTPKVKDTVGELMNERSQEGVLKYGYPPQMSNDSQNDEKPNSAKLERPRSLSIQQSEEQVEDNAANDINTEKIVENFDDQLDDIENDIEKFKVEDKFEDDLKVMADKSANLVEEQLARKTPSHLTEQGYFDLKFYHNKLW